MLTTTPNYIWICTFITTVQKYALCGLNMDRTNEIWMYYIHYFVTVTRSINVICVASLPLNIHHVL